MSTAEMAAIPIPLRPHASVARYIRCHSSSVSNGSAPVTSGARWRSTISFATRGASATLPSPVWPASVSTSTTVQPWKRNDAIVSRLVSRRSSRTSIAFVQKRAWGGTTSPVHSNTRARTFVIRMATAPPGW